MKGEFYSSTLNLPGMGHIWTAENLEDLRADLIRMRNDFNSTPVCDGGLRFRGEPVMTMARYYNVKGKRRKKKKKAS